MSNKMHLADSADPLPEFSTIKALCGETVERARFVLTWDEAEPLNMSDLYDAIAQVCCPKCMQVETDERYVYGIREDKESKKGKVLKFHEGAIA